MVVIEAENEEDAKQEFSDEFGYDFAGDNWHEVCCFEELNKRNILP